MITAIVPAVIEPDIDKTIHSLLAQTVAPDRIIVALNNTDDPDTTRLPALSVGDPRVEVIDHGACPGMKAEAINKTLALLPRDGLVMVTDADTELSPDFIEAALAELEDPSVGGVGAVFQGETPTSYLELCTFLEWARYEELSTRTGRTFVMSGTAALIRWEALEDVRAQFGHWYDESSITEDSALSVQLKLAGWQLRSPAACRATTEMMPTWPMLWKQRRRWYRGALDNVTNHGFSKVLIPYYVQQAMLTVSVLLMSLLVTLTVTAAVINGGPIAPEPFWLAIGAVFAVERVATVWDQPWPRRLFAAVVVPELIYALVLQTAFVAAVWQKAAGSAGTWAHLTPTPKGA